jgi:hypothetical protein
MTVSSGIPASAWNYGRIPGVEILVIARPEMDSTASLASARLVNSDRQRVSKTRQVFTEHLFFKVDGLNFEEQLQIAPHNDMRRKS